MLSHSPDLAANILKSRAPEKRCYRCLRAAFFNGCPAWGGRSIAGARSGSQACNEAVALGQL